MINYFIQTIISRRRNNHLHYPQRYFILPMNKRVESPKAGVNGEDSIHQTVYANETLKNANLV